MKPKTTGTLSGCIIWMIGFGILSTCIFPTAIMIRGVTPASNFAMQTVGSLICPNRTSFKSYSYPSTTTDEYGNTQPSTAYELHCIDTSGGILKQDPVLYAFLWIGIISIIGLVITALLALALAAPAGILISKHLHRRQQPDITASSQAEQFITML